MLKKEPVMIMGALAALSIFGVLLAVLPDERQDALWVCLFPIIGGIVARAFAFSPNTLEQAGLNPDKVAADAKANDPSVGRTI